MWLILGGMVRNSTASYDIVVVGAGHAGCEAALAAARMGARTLLLTMNLDLVAQMPCNPGVGGPAKGHLLREIDALGGEMARNLDRTFTQIRLLNMSKGAAVRAPRVQVDKRLYSLAMKHTLENTDNLELRQAMVEGLNIQGDRVVGVQTKWGEVYAGECVIMTTGTFLRGRVMQGERSHSSGRAGETCATRLATALDQVGFRLGRHQTHTPPRVDARTIDFGQTTPQYGSAEPLYVSLVSPPEDVYRLPFNPVYPIGWQSDWRAQLPCYLVHTNQRSHAIIRENLERSPVIMGNLDGSSPRYCPSIEEKMVRFPHAERHQLFLEPEGFATTEVYVQGLYTALPQDIQLQVLHSIPALAGARIVRPGYGVDYDYAPARQLHPSLETKLVEGLFHAGQINGTSGYEEAAAQGLMAGVNAALKVAGREPLVLRRDQGYIGVLIDDLVAKDIREPYRMLTSRCEYRLLLRQDNADLRLTPEGYAVGLIPYARYAAVADKQAAVDEELTRLGETWLAPDDVNAVLTDAGRESVDDGVNALALLRRPGVDYSIVSQVAPRNPSPLSADVTEQVEIEARYAGYIAKQRRRVEQVRRLEEQPIGTDFDYRAVTGLRREAVEQLEAVRPRTLGQASRLAGVTPADVSLLMVVLTATSSH